LGAYFNKHPVSDNFKVIVFLNDDKETLKQTDPPFLNRFEKHVIDIKEFLTKKMSKVITFLVSWIQMFFEKHSYYKSHINNIIPGYSEENLQILVFLMAKKLERKYDKFSA